MKVLFIADIHIKLGQKNVPHDWARNRYKLLWEAVDNLNRDLIIFGGDIFDRVPTMEEIDVFFEMLAWVDGKKILYPGNHEATSKYGTFLDHFSKAVEPFNARIFTEFTKCDGFSILPYNELKKDHWHKESGDLLFTHVRGEIPPHVKPEVDLNLFNNWKTVVAGDLHARSNSQRNIYYPGSPVTTSFHRSVQTGENGIYLVDTQSGEIEFVDLGLPQLIRLTVDCKDKMVKTEYHHTVYELVGDIVDLQQVENSELLDKKISNTKSNITLDLRDMTMEEELFEYLLEILDVNDPEAIMKEYHDSIAEINLE